MTCIGRIASRYDLLCDVFSFGIHRLWKRRVAQCIASDEWSTLLDGATGTGDIIFRLMAHKGIEGRTVNASDISTKMLAQDRAKAAGLLNREQRRSYPRQMLRARVISEGCRTVFPGSTGIVYTAEEVADMDQDATPPRDVTPPADAPRSTIADELDDHVAALERAVDLVELKSAYQTGYAAAKAAGDIAAIRKLDLVKDARKSELMEGAA